MSKLVLLQFIYLVLALIQLLGLLINLLSLVLNHLHQLVVLHTNFILCFLPTLGIRLLTCTLVLAL